MTPYIHINGTLLPAEKALLSPDERGFRFGDGVFETIPLHNSIPYLLEYHLQRLQGGLDALGIPYNTSNLPDAISGLTRANQATSGAIRLYISRGIGSTGYLPVEPRPAPTTIIQHVPATHTPDAPVALWVSSYEKISPRALPTSFKHAQGLNASLARMEARDQNCYDCVQLSASGHVSEASSANIFWVKDDNVFTPSLSTGALAGVTRRRIMEFLQKRVTEVESGLAELLNADEVFLTSSTHGVVSVEKLLPAGSMWNVTTLAYQLNRLRQDDIRDYVSRGS